MFFTSVNPMEDDQTMEEIRCNLDKPRIAPYKNTWKRHQNTLYFCNLKLAQKRGLQFYQTRSHAIVLNWKRSRNVENKINKNKTQEHLVTTQAHRRVPRKLGATTLTTEYLAYSILQSNNRTRIAEAKSKRWFSSSRATRTRSLSCRTWIRLKKLMNSATSRRSWSRRSSFFARPLPKNNAPIVHFSVRLALSVVLVDNFFNLRKELRSWTRTTTTSYQFQTKISKRTPFAVPNMEPSQRQRMYCKAEEMLQKACQPKHGGFKSIWHKDDQCRNSLSLIG